MRNLMISVVLVFVVAFLSVGCDKKEADSTSKTQEAPAEKAMVEPEEEAGEVEEGEDVVEGEGKAMNLGQLATGGSLLAAEDENGATENNEGVAHFKEGHWDVAEKHFLAALAVNEKLAEAHYNLALALDKLGNHGDATAHFKNALELAPGNVNISESQILKDHLGG